MTMTISHHHTSKWKENRSTKPVIRRLPIRYLVELGMHTVLKLKSEFTFPVIDENDLKYHIKKMIILFSWLASIKFRKCVFN